MDAGSPALEQEVPPTMPPGLSRRIVCRQGAVLLRVSGLADQLDPVVSSKLLLFWGVGKVGRHGQSSHPVTAA